MNKRTNGMTTRNPRNAVSHLPSPDPVAFIILEKQEPNLMQMLQSWSKGNINGEIQLYSFGSLQNPGFMALALIALEKQS